MHLLVKRNSDVIKTHGTIQYDKKNLVIFRHVRIMVKTSIIVVISVHLYETIRLRVVGFLWSLTRITCTLHEDLCTVHLWKYRAELLLQLEIFQKKAVEKLKTQILCSVISFLEKLSQEYGHTFTIFNTATMVTRMRLIVTLYVRCLSCWQYGLQRNDALQTSTELHIVHIGVPVLRYQTNTDKSSHILLNHQFINTLRNSNMFRPLKVHLQGV